MSRRGFRVNVLDLLRQPGARRHVHDVIEAAEQRMTSTRIPDGADLDFDLVAEAHGVQIVVTGTVAAPWVGECRRCLETTEGTVEVSLREVFDRDPVEGETWPISGDSIDLAPVLVQAVLLELPLAPLCRPSCAGPAPDRFLPTLEEDGSDEIEDIPRDPRWAVLDVLRTEDDPET
jgi:uncharacterized protein